jgi:hypothetical protein
LKSSAKKHSPTYKLKVRYDAPSGKKWEDKEVEGQFTQWFNTHGFLQKKEFQRWLAQNIEVVGMADPQSEQQGDKMYEAAIDQSIMASGVETAQGTTGKRAAGKPKKKA